MTAIVKIQRKGQMTLPSSFREAMGVSEGSLVELSLKNGKTVISPKVVIDRSKFSTTDDEYTPEQRRVIDARLAEGLADLKAGRVYGPFDTHEQMMDSLRNHDKKIKAKNSKRT